MAAAADELISLQDKLANLKSASTGQMSRDEALQIALQCAELQMSFLKFATDKTESKQMTGRCNRILQEAEKIKKESSSWEPQSDLFDVLQPLTPAAVTYQPPSAPSPEAKASFVDNPAPGLDITIDRVWPSLKPRETANAIPKTLTAPKQSRKLPRGEQILLLKASKLNDTIFPPWEEDPDPAEFALGEDRALYSDGFNFGFSDEQRRMLDGWKRPPEAMPPPSWRKTLQHEVISKDYARMSRPPDFVQDAATDCSVVASMCTGAARAQQGHARILTGILFPHDAQTGTPTISPNGKYVVRLNFNGCARKVIIDDRLPVTKNSRVLHVVDRNNPYYIWPALMEKAYLKMRGGYDFPGSNSATDLWILTGWIPEQIFLDTEVLDVGQLWQRVHNAFKNGDVLITLGTGKYSSKSEKALGLASEHDYAVLDFKESDDRNLLLIKNPWFEGCIWKNDIPSAGSSLVNELEESLNGFPILRSGRLPTTEKGTLRPGTFWMDMDDAIQHFESMYLNWNPGLFTHRQDVHFSWDLSPDACGKSATGSCSSNPQYSVSSTKGGITYFVLSRHFSGTLTSSFIDGDSGFISLNAFASEGKRVILSKGAIQKSPYIDSPQTLLTVELKPNYPYTIVVSEQELQPTLHTMTLSAFSHSPLVIERAPSRYLKKTSSNHEWTPSTAGGNSSYASYSVNPQFALQLSSPSPVAILLETLNPDLSVHVKLIYGQGTRIYSIIKRDVAVDSGEYLRGCALAETVVPLDAGTYTIICSTFEPGQLGDFRLHVESDVETVLRSIPREGAGRMRKTLANASFGGNARILAAPLRPLRLAKVFFKATFVDDWAIHSPIRLTVELGRGPDRQILIASADGSFSDALSGVRTGDVDLKPEMVRLQDVWLVLERMGGFSAEQKPAERISVEMFSDALDVVDVGVWQEWER